MDVIPVPYKISGSLKPSEVTNHIQREEGWGKIEDRMIELLPDRFLWLIDILLRGRSP